MDRPAQMVFRILISLLGALLLVVSIAVDLAPLFQDFKTFIWLDMVLLFIHPYTLAIAVGLLGLYLLVTPWLSAWYGRVRKSAPGSGKKGNDRRFLLVTAALALGLALAIHWWVLGGMLVTPDEYAYLFQAKLFAAGRLWADSHPLQEFFQAPFIASHLGRLFSIFPHGWSVLLVPAVWMGVPWLLNPLFGALTIALLYKIGLRWYDRSTARWAAVIMLCSPFFLFNSATGMSHSSSLFMVMMILLLILGKAGDRSAHETGGSHGGNMQRPAVTAAQVPRALAIGLLSGMIAVTHHLDLFFLVPAIAYFAFRRFEPKAFAIRSACLAAGFALPVALLLWLWARQTGDLLTTPVSVYIPDTDFPGFVPEDGSIFTFSRGMEAVALGLRHTKQWFLMLSLWIFPGATFFLLPFLGFRKNRCDWLLLTGTATLAMGYFFYHSPGGWQYGPRFFYPALPGLALLIAKGILGLPGLAARLLRRPVGRAWAQQAAVGLLLTGVVLGGGLGVLMNYITTNLTGPVRSIQEAGATPAILFLDFKDPSSLTNLTRNSPDFDDPVFVCRDLGSRDRELMEYYPNRRYFRVEADHVGVVALLPDQVRRYEVTPETLESPDDGTPVKDEDKPE